MIDETRELFAYDRWANQRMLDVVATLSPEDYTRDMGSSYDSVRDTLVHLLGAEWIWLRRWKGTSPKGMPEDWDTSTLPALRAHWAEVEREQVDYLEALHEPDLRRVVDYQNTKGTPYAQPLGDLMRHVINHSTYHRGQVTTLLRQLGATPANTDLVTYLREQRA